MDRRSGDRRDGRTTEGLNLAADPFALLGFDLAWRADDALDDGANTTALPSYIGSLTLARDATGQAVKAASANFGGRPTITCSGANRGYTGALAVASSMTFVSVYRPTAGSGGTHGFTVGGAVNTGNGAGYSSASFSNKLSTPANRAIALSSKIVCVSVFSSAGISHYANSYTPTVVASAGALVGDTLTLLTLDTAGTWTLTGEWRRAGYADRALSAAEAAIVLTLLGSQEQIAIAA